MIMSCNDPWSFPKLLHGKIISHVLEYYVTLLNLIKIEYGKSFQDMEEGRWVKKLVLLAVAGAALPEIRLWTKPASWEKGYKRIKEPKGQEKSKE